MQVTPFNLDSALERGEIGEELGFDTGLQLANSPDKRLQVMKATEYVLGIFQEGKRHRISVPSRFVSHFKRVTEFLDGDPHAVQRVGGVHRPRSVDRRAQTTCAPRHARIERRQPDLGTSRGSKARLAAARRELLFRLSECS